MSHLVDWKKTFQEARTWVLPTSPWTSVILSEDDPGMVWFTGKDCFYVDINAKFIPYTRYVKKVFLDGSTKFVRLFSSSYKLSIFREKLYLHDGRNHWPVDHDTPWEDCMEYYEIPSWESTPGTWKYWREIWDIIPGVQSPDGTFIPTLEEPVGVFRNKVVVKTGFGEETLTGPYHLVRRGGRMGMCRNLLRDGLASPGGTLESQFFLLPQRNPGKVLF